MVERIPARVRLVVLTATYGLAAGLSTVAFMLAVNGAFQFLWGRLTSRGPFFFVVASLFVVVLTSVASGILMTRVCPEAAGSGIPQLKAAYWRELGVVSFRSVLVKFLGGVLAIGGGASLGREGPTVYIAGGLASQVAAALGIERKRRRHAAAAGSAAGLAAAFNTPLAAISFVLEEILGDLNSRLLGSVVLASVAGAFIVYAMVGQQPAFAMPAVDSPSWDLYMVVPLAAALGALAGVAFQRGALALRLRARTWNTVPVWMRPAVGGFVTWIVGCAVYLAVGRIGVFGLGYGDLSDALLHGLGWKIAGLLAVAKLVATVASYGTGGCGGIFSPTLFIGAMCGFFAGGVADHWIPLTPADQLILAATGMSACLGAVVRAPFTGILMIFEMTHQFGMVPALMIGTLVSQAIARLAGGTNFYDAVLVQDGHEIHKIAPPHDLAGWRSMPVRSMANRKPVWVTSLEPDHLREVIRRHPFRCFPCLTDGKLAGVLTRREIEHALARGMPPVCEPAVVCLADQTLRQIEPRLIESSGGLFLVREREGGPVTGVFTLHDLLRAQAALLE